MLTYQDYLEATDTAAFIAKAISQHMASAEWKIARDADLYDRQQNVTINRMTKAYQMAGGGNTAEDAPGLCLASNWFNRFNTQRASYLLGNGVTFTRREKRANAEGRLIDVDVTKEELGCDFDNQLYEWGYTALIHGVSFGFWNLDRLLVFHLTEFVPQWDEETGALRAGIRFWRLTPDKPMTAVLYTEDGYTTYRTKDRSAGMNFVAVDDNPRPYVEIVETTEADGEIIAGAENYGAFPIVPMWGSRKKQSTLVGFRDNIDAYDLIKAGYCTDQRDTAKIYWLIENCGAMDREAMDRFLDDIKRHHIANVYSDSFTGDARSALTPYTQEVPYQGNEACLDRLARDMYRDFGAVDTSTIPAGATNDQIESAYQPMDEEADQFEVQAIKASQQLLRLKGIEDTPQFKRNRTSNVKETVEAVMLLAAYLDPEAVLDHVQFITVDEKERILEHMDAVNAARLTVDKTAANAAAGNADGAETAGTDDAA